MVNFFKFSILNMIIFSNLLLTMEINRPKWMSSEDWHLILSFPTSLQHYLILFRKKIIENTEKLKLEQSAKDGICPENKLIIALNNYKKIKKMSQKTKFPPNCE